MHRPRGCPLQRFKVTQRSQHPTDGRSGIMVRSNRVIDRSIVMLHDAAVPRKLALVRRLTLVFFVCGCLSVCLAVHGAPYHAPPSERHFVAILMPPSGDFSLPVAYLRWQSREGHVSGDFRKKKTFPRSTAGARARGSSGCGGLIAAPYTVHR